MIIASSDVSWIMILFAIIGKFEQRLTANCNSLLLTPSDITMQSSPNDIIYGVPGLYTGMAKHNKGSHGEKNVEEVCTIDHDHR